MTIFRTGVLLINLDPNRQIELLVLGLGGQNRSYFDLV